MGQCSAEHEIAGAIHYCIRDAGHRDMHRCGFSHSWSAPDIPADAAQAAPVLGEEAAVHSVTIECEPNGYWPTLTFTCQAPPDAECRTTCRNPECEEGCYHFGEPGHEREAVDYCNTVEWLENADEVAGDIFGGPTAITAPILVSWERGEDGPDWRFARLGQRDDQQAADRACWHRYPDGTLCTLSREAHALPGIHPAALAPSHTEAVRAVERVRALADRWANVAGPNPRWLNELRAALADTATTTGADT